jgi:SAM-dependent methyltransferase
MRTDPRPQGTETLPFGLDVLSGAARYQEWVFRTVEPFLGRRVLEIGSGVGNMSTWLPPRERLILSDTDPTLLEILRRRLGDRVDGAATTLAAYDPSRDHPDGLVSERLDTIVSFNVLEHVDDDQRALSNLTRILRDGDGPYPRRLITFVPAHQWAYGTLDAEFGHHRRYSRDGLVRLLRTAAPEAVIRARYFNAVGLPGWLLAGKVLRRRRIDEASVRGFERLCPLLRPLDEALHRRLRLPLGQSLFALVEWRSGPGGPPTR